MTTDEGSSSERLQKWLARTGVAPSRRTAERWIEEGRLRVDGRVATVGTKVDATSNVELDGTPLVAQRAPSVVIVLHKPRGVVTTMHDPRGRTTVRDLIPSIPGLHPVGRLDADSEGLLLLTTDGDLTYRLTHPKHETAKVYRAWCTGGTLDDHALERLRGGVRLEDGAAKADAAWPAQGGVRIQIHEGRNRQVRRMLDAVGYPVERLLRTDIACVSLGTLEPGAWRYAVPKEANCLGYASDVTRRTEPLPRSRR